jgi:hypothetical protein
MSSTNGIAASGRLLVRARSATTRTTSSAFISRCRPSPSRRLTAPEETRMGCSCAGPRPAVAAHVWSLGG